MLKIRSSYKRHLLTLKKLIHPLIVLFFLSFPISSLAIFQIKFFGGPLTETQEASTNYKKGTLFKTLISYGENLRLTSSFTYSQSSQGQINFLQGELGFGAAFYPHYSEPVPFFQPYLHLEAVGVFGTEEDLSNTNPKEQRVNGAANIGVGMDINFSRTFGILVGVEVHNFKQHRLLVGFLQGY